jgi:hypothetical protein
MVTIEKKSIKVGKLVDTEHVETLIRNYKQERWAHNSKRIGKEDSLSVWFSVSELEEFFTKVKDCGGNGIRIHFGSYGADFTDNPLYADRQTVVLVATKEKETEHGPVNKSVYFNKEGRSSILAYNFGTLCPPACTPDNGDKGIGITIVDKGVEGMIIA